MRHTGSVTSGRGVMKKPSLIPIKAYAAEIFNDLPTLMQANPNGVYISYLSSWYGESHARTVKACKLLASKGRAQYVQAGSKAYFLVPANYKIHPLLLLTPLQRSLVNFLYEQTGGELKVVRTNYSQLSRLLKCSHAGIKTCIQRCRCLGVLDISGDSQRGKQDTLLLKLNIKIPRDTE